MTKETIDTQAAEELKKFIERIERLTSDKKSITTDISEVYKEAENRGYDKKAMKAVIKHRAADKKKLEELESMTELYLGAVGTE